MLDFNLAFSRAAWKAKQREKKEAKKKLSASILASCEGKVSFDSFRDAEKIADAKRKSVKNHRRAYHCFHCQRYHIGT